MDVSPPAVSSSALISNDAVICGILLLIIASVFYTHSLQHPAWRRFYTWCPKLLLCYFLPALLGVLGVYDASESKLYFIASRYFLPASLVLLTLPTHLGAILRLGPRAGLVFLSGTIGVIVGGPVAFYALGFLAPDLVAVVGKEAVARGLSSVAGSWIGGGANQAAMKEVFDVDNQLFGLFLGLDIVVANLWMVVLLLGAQRKGAIDRLFGARDVSELSALEEKMRLRQPKQRLPMTTTSLLILSAMGLGGGAMGHLIGDALGPWIGHHFPTLAHHSLASSFFWLVVSATGIGLLLSFTPARHLEARGASALGEACLYFLVATIGMNMRFSALLDYPGMFLAGGIWISIHILCMCLVARLLRAPFFYVAVGSQANIGGAASAPVVAGAFHPSLAPVGVLLAVLGYTLGTYGAYLCGIWMYALAR